MNTLDRRCQLKKLKICSFFGHRDCRLTGKQKNNLYELIENLIISFNVKEFLFGEHAFDKISFYICLDLKMKYPEINLIYVRAKNENPSKDFIDKILELYDDTYFPKSAHNSGKYCYIKRNFDMIEKSDYCIFYYLERTHSISREFGSNKIIKTKSGTKIALDYAKKKSKELSV